MKPADAMRWIGLIGIASIAVLRCLVLFAPQVVFDTDPAVKDSMPLAGLGPAGSLLIDVLLMGVCVIALLSEWRSGRGVDVWLLLLALIPMPIVMWHGAHDAGNLWRGTTWLAAVIACVTVAHLARDRFMRSMLIALLLATIVPLLARGAAQMTFEHAGTVQVFEQSKEQFLGDKGWEPDSSAARIFERRLRQPQPLGWFTTTNIFASLAGFSFIVFIGLAVSATRAKLQSGWAGAMTLLALAAGAGLFFTGAKGAIGAVILGLGVFWILDFGYWILDASPLPTAGSQSKIQNPKSKIAFSPGALIIILLALTVLAVIARGLLLPEGFAHEKSLLFRWHYMIASARMFMDHALLGVGADGYQEAYTLYRVPRNPEEVTSAHSMFIDWLCTLGVAGVAWIAMVCLLVRRIGEIRPSCDVPATKTSAGHSHIPKKVRTSSGRVEPVQSVERFDARKSCIVALAVFALGVVPAMVIEWPALERVGLMLRVLAGIGFVVAAAMIGYVIHLGHMRTAAAAIIGAIAVLLIHGQIEMTFQQPGAVVWAMCAVGLTGCAKAARPHGGSGVLPVSLTSATIMGAMIWVTISGVLPACRQQRAMLRAAESLRPIAQNPDDVGLMIERRRAAAEALVDAYGLWSMDVRPLEAAVNQLELASSRPAGPQPLGMLMNALDLANRAVREHGKSSSLVIVVGLNATLGQLTGDGTYWNGAIDAAHQLTVRDPNSLNAWRRLGDVYWVSGNRSDAAAAYRRALECDVNFALDEFKRLSEKDRARLMERLSDSKMIQP